MYTIRNKALSNPPHLTTRLEGLPYFTLDSLLSLSNHPISTVKTTAHRWIKSKKLLSLKKGVYTTSLFYKKYAGHPEITFIISSIINPNSYVSLETILNIHGVLTESIYNTFAITPKKTTIVCNDIGNFLYKNIKPSLFIGFEFKQFLGVTYAKATLAKALFDYLYLKKVPLKSSINIAEYLRLNLFVFNKNDILEFEHYVKLSSSKKMLFILNNFNKFLGEEWKN